jgi:hypothetical protein
MVRNGLWLWFLGIVKSQLFFYFMAFKTTRTRFIFLPRFWQSLVSFVAGEKTKVQCLFFVTVFASIELTGHGKSDHSNSNVNHFSYGFDVVDVADALQLSSFHLVGHRCVLKERCKKDSVK